MISYVFLPTSVGDPWTAAEYNEPTCSYRYTNMYALCIGTNMHAEEGITALFNINNDSSCSLYVLRRIIMTFLNCAYKFIQLYCCNLLNM